ncbi:MAG: Ig-like domain-containing protein [Thermoflexales bacterium]|nr:Ig-like domain-containing protein [Thermoflexales bacterium]
MRLDRMDRVAIGSILTLSLLIVFFVVRGDQVGVRITRTSPAMNAERAPTRSLIAITFSEPMSTTSVEQRLRITPPVSGTWRWSGSTIFLSAAQPLQPDTHYTVTLASGAVSTRGRSVLRDVTWTFRTRHPRLVYLAPASGIANLFVLDPRDGTTQRLTNEPYGIYDFAVSPDGARIVYSADRNMEAAERDIYIINSDGSGRELLVKCDDHVCQAMSWSPDGARIAFERRALIQGVVGRSPGPGRIWLADIATKETAPLFGDSQQIASLPRYAPVGDRLAFYDVNANNIVVLDLATDRRIELPSVLGDPGTWSPDGSQLIYPELEAFDAGRYDQLLRADLIANTITPVTPLEPARNSGAVWSPLGDTVVFGRQEIGGSSGILGPQVFLIAPDGSNMRRLTSEPEISHGAFAWSPDGQWIAVQRYNLLEINSLPELWLFKADGSERRKLVTDGTQPAWLP